MELRHRILLASLPLLLLIIALTFFLVSPSFQTPGLCDNIYQDLYCFLMIVFFDGKSGTLWPEIHMNIYSRCKKQSILDVFAKYGRSPLLCASGVYLPYINTMCQRYLFTREHNALFVYDLLFLFLIADINKETGVKHVVAIGP